MQRSIHLTFLYLPHGKLNQQDKLFTMGKEKLCHAPKVDRQTKRNQRCFVAMAKNQQNYFCVVTQIADGAKTSRVNSNLICSLQV